MRLIELQRDGEKDASGSRIWPGAYRIPADLPNAIADRLLASGAAILLWPVPGATAAAKAADKPRARWDGATVVIAATGPSLTQEVCDQVGLWRAAGERRHVVAISDAYRLMPWADVLYSHDAAWWNVHADQVKDFAGEKWSSRKRPDDDGVGDDGKDEIAAKLGVQLVEGRLSDRFSVDPCWISYGPSSLFQAIGLAINFGAAKEVIVGADMRSVKVGKGKDAKALRHFFGDHPAPLNNSTKFEGFIPAFDRAAKHVPPGVTIVNATPGSAMKSFPEASLDEALAD